MRTSLLLSAGLIGAGVHAGSVQVPPVPHAKHCTKEYCPFSVIKAFSYVPLETRCGEVDAAPRMPDDIWKNQAAVDAYVAYVSNYWVNPLQPSDVGVYNGPCNRTRFPIANGTMAIEWATKHLMESTCTEQRCGCNYPHCPDTPDDP